MSSFSHRFIHGRLTRDALKYSIDIARYNNKDEYPFINYQPITQMSEQALELDLGLKNDIMPVFVQNIYDLNGWRKAIDDFFTEVPSNDECVVENIMINNSVKCVKFAHAGSSIDNGVIIAIHGGGFICGTATSDHYKQISKYSGCVVISVDYTLTPEQSIDDMVSEVVTVYEYFVNYYKNKNEKCKIALSGESAGGDLVLLTLLRLRDAYDKLKLPMPSCAWMISPWIDLTQSRSPLCYKYNGDYDAVLSKQLLDWYSQIAIQGELAKNGKKSKKGKNDRKLLNKYLALDDDFDGIECPMYFMVGATEVLLDDSILMAQKIYQNKNIRSEVIVDVEPFLWHGWTMFGVPESTCAIAKATQWILKYFDN